MADSSASLIEAWRRLAEANVRYYTSSARIAREYFDEVVAALRGPVSDTGGMLGARPAAARPAPAARPVVMALDGEPGATVSGAFVVENAMDRRVRGPIVASDDGTNGCALRFEPSEIELEPGEHVLVRALATIDEALTPEAPYRAEVTVPGLPGTRINLLVRRR